MSVERATGHSRQRDCPACGAPTIVLPAISSRRRRPVTCTSCGRRLEVVYPKAWYYTLSLATGLLAELSIIPLLLLLISRQWAWIATVVTGFMLVNYLATAFLNARAAVRPADDLEEVSRKEVFGRWYPK